MNKRDVGQVFQDEAVSVFLEALEQARVVRFIGSLTQPKPETLLEGVMACLREEASNRPVPLVTIDMTGMAFSTSRGLRALVRWLMELSALAQESHFRIELVYAEHMVWQRSISQIAPLVVPGLGMIASAEQQINL